MRPLDYFNVAFKNLRRQKVRTALTIIAITVGSLSLILMASIIISIRASLVDQFNKLGAFNLVTVTRDPNSDSSSIIASGNGDPTEGKLITDATVTQVQNIVHVTKATPTLVTNVNTARIEGQNKKTWANLIAYNPDNNVFNLPLVAGRNLESSDMDKIVIGQRLIEVSGMSSHPKDLIGKKVIISMKSGGGQTPDWGPAPAPPPANMTDEQSKAYYEKMKSIEITAEIVGVTNSGNADDGQSYINITWARRLNTWVQWQYPKDQPLEMKKKNYQPQMVLVKNDDFVNRGYSSVILLVDDQKNIKSVANEVSKLGYGAVTAQKMLDQINKILVIIGAVLAAIGGISLFVAAIGIINTMIMATFERIREIGVMRACGATRKTIRWLFTIEAALLGFWGGVFGVIICYGIGTAVRLIIKNTGGGAGSTIPMDKIGSFPWWLIIGVIAFATILGTISGLYPAFRASRLDPVEALRYE